MKKLAILSMLCMTALTLLGCSKIGSTAKEAPFKTQTIEIDKYQFEIPDTWKRVEDPNINSALYIFTPENADLTKNSSNVAITIIPKTDKSPTMEQLKSSTAGLEKQIKGVFKDAKDFKFDELSVPSGKVFTLSYSVQFGDITMVQTQYYILMDNQTVVITSTDIGDGVSPSPIEVINHMAESFKEK
ncbi:PsbP-related protein [Anaeromicropila herbilytica]|uniref:PsbP C-terminal domain-containing protein n=1 Tax=Anaeromicropila herbilytica TaxID=2785025 RepID=A0A7R7IG68_9FIRM|nr:PsbP-related protein [Anaeromicropila herbilytica]BCN32768.1 hypothetical protein bsdtb5_40630 [Anaeromicropila herbilytica]